ncbi:unnamed protein product [Urochloa humidicola]
MRSHGRPECTSAAADPPPSAPDPVKGRADPRRGGPSSAGPEMLHRRVVVLSIRAGKRSRGRRRQLQVVRSRTPAPAWPSDPAHAPVVRHEAILEKAAVGGSGGGKIHRFRRPHRRRAPPRARTDVLPNSSACKEPKAGQELNRYKRTMRFVLSSIQKLYSIEYQIKRMQFAQTDNETTRLVAKKGDSNYR